MVNSEGKLGISTLKLYYLTFLANHLSSQVFTFNLRCLLLGSILADINILKEESRVFILVNWAVFTENGISFLTVERLFDLKHHSLVRVVKSQSHHLQGYSI